MVFATLSQNAFPTLEKYIDHVHTVNVKAAKVSKRLSEIILLNFQQLIELKERGIDLFFPDIDKIKQQMEEELEKSQ